MLLRKKLNREWVEEPTAIFHWKIAILFDTRELNCSVKQRKIVQAECRGYTYIYYAEAQPI